MEQNTNEALRKRRVQVKEKNPEASSALSTGSSSARSAGTDITVLRASRDETAEQPQRLKDDVEDEAEEKYLLSLANNKRTLDEMLKLKSCMGQLLWPIEGDGYWPPNLKRPPSQSSPNKSSSEAEGGEESMPDTPFLETGYRFQVDKNLRCEMKMRNLGTPLLAIYATPSKVRIPFTSFSDELNEKFPNATSLLLEAVEKDGQGYGQKFYATPKSGNINGERLHVDISADKKGKPDKWEEQAGKYFREEKIQIVPNDATWHGTTLQSLKDTIDAISEWTNQRESSAMQRASGVRSRSSSQNNAGTDVPVIRASPDAARQPSSAGPSLEKKPPFEPQAEAKPDSGTLQQSRLPASKPSANIAEVVAEARKESKLKRLKERAQKWNPFSSSKKHDKENDGRGSGGGDGVRGRV